MPLKAVHADADAGLLRELRDGSEAAFEQVYRLYSLRIYWNILKMVRSEETAQELLQDVFLKVWEKRAQIDPELSFRSYLFQIAKHLVYNFTRREALDQKLKNYFGARNSELYTHVEENLADQENNAFLRQAIEKLPPQRKLVYTRCKLEGKTYEEVGRELNISVSTISDHIVKATRFIKQQHDLMEGALALTLCLTIFHGL